MNYLAIMLVLLCLAVAYFHYIQGILSSALSAILATFAAVIAVGMHESLAKILVGQKFPEFAAAISLVVLFAGIYIILRVLLDMVVPGNVRVPVMVDKVGAGAFGLWAGLISTGILAIAAQSLPLWPTVGGYGRYEVVPERSKIGVMVSGYTHGQDVKFDSETLDDTMDPQKANHLWFHQDDLVLGLAGRESNSGALRGDVQWSAVHPDYLTELFGQRLGIQIGAKRTMGNGDINSVVKCTGVYNTDGLPKVDGGLRQVDGESPALRPPNTKVEDTLKPMEGKVLLVVRLKFSGTAADIADAADGKFRFSPGTVRLCIGQSGDTPNFHDFYPVAVLHGKVAVFQRIDDFLVVDTHKAAVPPTIDFIFQVDSDLLDKVDKSDDTKGMKLHKGAFVAVKRYGIADLSDLHVQKEIPANPTLDAILRKPDVVKTLGEKAG